MSISDRHSCSFACAAFALAQKEPNSTKTQTNQERLSDLETVV